MMKRKILWLVPVCLSLALPAGAATYDYYLQVPADPQAGLAAWTATWTSNSLNPPLCPAGTISPFLVGTPMPDYTATISFCLQVNPPIVNPIPVVIATWANSINSQVDYTFTFSSTAAPFTTGAFTASDSFGLVTGGDIFVGPYSGPPATLTIAQAVSFPPIPSWLGSIINLSFVVEGPVTPLPGVPVEATVGFVDINGNPIGQTSTVPLVPGQVSSVELNTATFLTTLGHEEVIPVVSAPQGQLLPAVQMTAEVYDRLTGFGGVLTSVNGLAPPPTTLAPQGLALGQIMRLTATAYPPVPCDATLTFVNSEGVAIGPSVTVSLAPGQSQALDLKSATLGLTLGHRTIVQPVVALQPVISAAAVVSPACMVSSDVFDTITGRTWTYQMASVQ